MSVPKSPATPRGNGDRDNGRPGRAKPDRRTTSKAAKERQSELDRKASALEQRESDLDAREAELAAGLKKLEVDRAALRGDRKVTAKRTADLRIEEQRMRRREEEAAEARGQARREKEKFQRLSDALPGGDGRSGKFIKFVIPVLTLIVGIVTTLLVYDANSQQRQVHAADSEAASASLTVDYVVLPHPTDLTRSDLSPVVRDFYSGSAHRTSVVMDHRYYQMEPLSFQDLVSGQTVDCVTTMCERVVRREASARFETVYLRLTNIGPNTAMEIEVTLEPFLPSPIEDPHFNGVFAERRDQHDPITLDEEEGVDILRHGEAVLVPVAAVAVFEPEGSRTYVGMRSTRKPTQMCWRDGPTGETTCKPVREIHRRQVLISGEIPSGG